MFFKIGMATVFILKNFPFLQCGGQIVFFRDEDLAAPDFFGTKTGTVIFRGEPDFSGEFF